MTAVLDVKQMNVTFPQRGKDPVRAVRNVSFTIGKGDTLGLVGESGCGKTTLSRAILGLVPASGEVQLNGEPLNWKKGGRALRKRVQLVFQDPYSSLNPRLTVERALMEPLKVHFNLSGAEARKRVADMLEQVELSPRALGKYPHEFSGGQRQRVAIARALIVKPEVLIADEPVSALDVSVQARILNLLMERREAMGCAMLFISHDLAVVRHIADRIAVMWKGGIIETGPASSILSAPSHEYTKTLLEAAAL